MWYLESKLNLIFYRLRTKLSSYEGQIEIIISLLQGLIAVSKENWGANPYLVQVSFFVYYHFFSWE